MRNRAAWMSAGLAIILCAVGLYAAGWSVSITGHPKSICVVLALGCIVFLWGLLPGRARPSAPTSSIPASVNAPLTYNPTININNNQIFQSPEEPPSKPVEPESKPDKAINWLDASGPELMTVSKQIVYWVASPKGQPGLVLWINNKPPGEGGRSETATDLFASIVFSKGDHRLAHISRACWLSQQVNQVDIGVGERKGIILGTFREKLWSAWENPRVEPFRPTLKGPNVAYGPEEHHVVFEQWMGMEVTVVSAQTGMTVKKVVIDIFLKENGELEIDMIKTTENGSIVSVPTVSVRYPL
jgi:hypothetical protein